VTHLARLSVPLRSPEDVIPHLGKPTHWKHGRSAKALADSWFRAGDIPKAVRSVIEKVEWFEGARLVDAFVERKTDLNDGCGAPSQTDLLAIVSADRERELAILAIEAKVDESFGPLVDEWLDGSERKEKRLAGLLTLFRLPRGSAGALRYQLFHRAAAAIYEAQRYNQDVAALVVQSFCPNSTGFDDFSRFASAIGFEGASIGGMTNGRSFGGITLLLGWAPDVVPEELKP
jgi:hypothetical protein